MLDQLYSLGLRVELVTLFWVRKEEGPLADPNVQEKLGSGAEGSDDELEEGDGFDAGEKGVGVREREGTEAARSPKRDQFSCCSWKSKDYSPDEDDKRESFCSNSRRHGSEGLIPCEHRREHADHIPDESGGGEGQ